MSAPNDVPASEVFDRYQRAAERIALRDAEAAGLLLGLLVIARQMEKQLVEAAGAAQPGAAKE